MIKILLSLLLMIAGTAHFLKTDYFVGIMPPYLPLHRELVLVSGAIEIALGILLIPARTKKFAAWGAVLLFIAVFPANLHMAMHPELFSLSPAVLWLRLPLQAALILWAYSYTRLN